MVQGVVHIYPTKQPPLLQFLDDTTVENQSMTNSYKLINIILLALVAKKAKFYERILCLATKYFALNSLRIIYVIFHLNYAVEFSRQLIVMQIDFQSS